MSFPQESAAYPEASQASTALVLGIVGLVCCQVSESRPGSWPTTSWKESRRATQPAERGHGYRSPDHRDHRHGDARARDHRVDLATVAGVANGPLVEEFRREDMFR